MEPLLSQIAVGLFPQIFLSTYSIYLVYFRILKGWCSYALL